MNIKLFVVATCLTQTSAIAGLAASPPQVANQKSPNWPNLKEVIVVCKTHFDIGYTHRVKEIVQYYRTAMIDKAMDIMDQGKDLPPEQQFAWTCPGWVMSKVLDGWPGQTAQRRMRLDDYVKSGRFKFHALPFSLESDACEPEEIARGFIFSSNLCRKYNWPLPISGKMTDVPSHGGALATVLANGGVKFMHIGCNWPSGYVRTPELFWWEGPDGARVLTLYSSIYGSCTALWPQSWRSPVNFAKAPCIGDNLLPPPIWPHRVWPAIIVTPDNSGPPSAAAIQSLFADAQKRMPGVKFRMGTMDDFAEAILAENPDLPVVKAEMPDTWIHGIMCDPGGIKLSRAVHPQLASAEALHTQLGLWGASQPSIATEVAHAYEQILLYGEHTWGIASSMDKYGDAFKTADTKLVAQLEASWEDKTDYIRTAAQIAGKISDANLRTLASNVHTAPGSVIVYNPLPWTRSGNVAIEGQRFFAKDIPPCGYKTFSPKNLPPASAANTLESPFYKLTLDPATGSIASLVDKRGGREWVDAAASHRLGQYLNERFTFEQTLDYTVAYQNGRAFKSFGAAGEWPHPGMHKPGMISASEVSYRAAVSGKGIVSTDDGSATIECPADPANHMPATALRITLSQTEPYIELELIIKDKAKDNWPEADWLCLPFRIASPQFRVYRQLGVINPATDILDGANRDLFSVGFGVTITDTDGAGIAINSLDHPLVSLDRPGCWKYSKSAAEFIPKKPVAYVNLYNNQWNTNFRFWYPGTWSSRVRIWTFDAKTPADAVIATPAIEARNPLIAVSAHGDGNRLPAQQAGVSVSRKGVLLTAFGQNPDGDGTLLRIWEQAGVSGDLTVSLPPGTPFTTALPVNLRGETTTERLAIKGGKFSFPLGKYAPSSFILK